jgi:hypothetical protein
VDAFPYLSLEASLQPITRSVLRISLTLTPAFEWRVGGLGGARGRCYGGVALGVLGAPPAGGRGGCERGAAAEQKTSNK